MTDACSILAHLTASCFLSLTVLCFHGINQARGSSGECWEDRPTSQAAQVGSLSFGHTSHALGLADIPEPLSVTLPGDCPMGL